jgi:hypothetical protein
MPVIINEIEIIAPPPSRQEIRNSDPVNLPPPGPTPRDIYWVNRQMMSRQLRVHAR